MAKLIIDNITYEVPDGEQIAQACETAGIPFSCNSGVCGTCQIDILEGAENINELNREETGTGHGPQSPFRMPMQDLKRHSESNLLNVHSSRNPHRPS